MNPRILKFIIRPARFPEEVDLVRSVLRDYQTDIQVDLAFQNFDKELAELPGSYDVVLLGETVSGIAGCVGLRPDCAGVAELKRLFVYPWARGGGLGKALTVEAIDEARRRGYLRLHLDTLESKMPSALVLYRALGFRQVPGREGKQNLDLVDLELELASFSAGEC